jgi:hypothetical protein
MVATSVNSIILLPGLSATKAARCTLEAEWLHNNYDKCNVQVLQAGKFGTVYGWGHLLLPFVLFISPFSQTTLIINIVVCCRNSS